MNEKTKRVIQKRLLRILIIVCIVGFTIYLFASNAATLYELEQQKTQIAQQIEDEKVRSNQLDVQVKQMGSKFYVEYFARKYLGLYYPDETIIIVDTQ
ncbi:hypothetical protein GH810_00875 [Acetobacterium paludosum]|uniref:Septum formation initiator family protein n=1 Tax=Acetobacterium paludosum TaxID=52693 RepID=A0A923HVV2_9FIRM|nr:septum formation initiator family protein [Acetobacterium paludosum]MBC3886871.1 hypothetical protein [Acetobacterium paludosum]